MSGTPEYHAYLIGSPDVDLGTVGGTITLDESRSPHVQATVVVSASTQEVLEALDPRLSPRVRIEAGGEYPWFSGTREFNLSLRDRELEQESGRVTLTLASNEALLSSYAPLADDETPFSLAGSLRDVVDYVLDTVIPGESLAASPSNDADVTAYWKVTNRVYNPACEGIWGYSLGLNAKALGTGTGGVVGTKFVWWQSIAAGWTYCIADGDDKCTPGETITGAAWLTSSVGTLNGYAVLRFFDANGLIMVDIPGPAVTGLGTFPRATVTAVVPPGAASVKLVAGFQATAANQTLGWDGTMLIDGERVVAYHDGGTPDNAFYTYSWSGNAYESPSTRVPVMERDPESLTWRAGQSAIDFLAPLVQASGMRLVCDEETTWTLRDEDYAADGSLQIRYGVNLIDGSDSISLATGLWFDARVTRYVWTDRAGQRQERIDAYALHEPYTRATTMELETPYPGPGRSEYAVRRAQGRGREVRATTQADWRTRAEQACTIRLNGVPIQTGRTSRVEFDLDTDRVTVTARTTDTPEHAWILQDEASWTDGPAGESWMEAA